MGAGSSTPCSPDDWGYRDMKNILIIGATSTIAEATARILAQRGDRLYLLGRGQQRLAMMTPDLKIRGAESVESAQLDANDLESHTKALDSAFEALGTVDAVLIAHGTLPNQETCQKSFEVTLAELWTNAISTTSLLAQVANRLEAQGSGTIAAITSVAGDRGRQSNYVYGAAKGMVSIFLQGLRNRLHGSGVHVLDIKPGFVDTPMTAEFKKGLLWAKPEAIAKGIVMGIDKKKSTLYLPWFWRYIMLIIRHIPEVIFKRLSL